MLPGTGIWEGKYRETGQTEKALASVLSASPPTVQIALPPLQPFLALQLIFHSFFQTCLCLTSSHRLPYLVNSTLSLLSSSLFAPKPQSALGMWLQKWVFIYFSSLLVSQLEKMFLKSRIKVFYLHCLPLDPITLSLMFSLGLRAVIVKYVLLFCDYSKSQPKRMFLNTGKMHGNTCHRRSFRKGRQPSGLLWKFYQKAGYSLPKKERRGTCSVNKAF